MSDADKRFLGGPPAPPRPVGTQAAAPAPASSLIRKNRGIDAPPAPPRAIPAQAEKQESGDNTETAATSQTETPVPTDKSIQTLPDDDVTPEDRTLVPSVESNTAAQSTIMHTVDTPVKMQPTAAARTIAEGVEDAPAPAKRRRSADPKGESPDDMLKVTFDVRRGDRDAFNAAVAAAVLFEGHKNAGAFLAYIYNSERARLERDYNNGHPFEKRDKPLPRGGSFTRRGDA